MDAIDYEGDDYKPYNAVREVRDLPADPVRAALVAALEKIAGGFINSDFVTAVPPDWRKAYGQLQEIARDTLDAYTPSALAPDIPLATIKPGDPDPWDEENAP